MPLLCCHAKGLFSGPLSSLDKGVRRAGRRCGVSVAFERENPQQPASQPARDEQNYRRYSAAPLPSSVGCHSCGLRRARPLALLRAA
jgi:hypothetical protein